MTTNKALSTTPATHWSALQVLVVLLCFFINMFDGMDVLIMSYVAPAVAQDWTVSSARLGVVFSGGLIGMAVGGLLIAPLADKYGRRKLILASLVVMMAGMFSSGFSRNVNELLACRIVVGIGIGTVLAGMAAITAEYAPARHRSFAVGFLQSGYPIGAVATGFVAAWLLPHHGWRPLLIGGGVISLVLLPVVYFLMPESVSFLRRFGGPTALERINALRMRMGQPTLASLEALDTSVAAASDDETPPSLRSTLLLWTAVFMAMMVLYFIISWIPKLAIEAGLDLTKGIYAGAVYNIGAAVGIVGLSLLSIRVRLQTLVPAFLISAAVMMVVFGSVEMPVAGVLLVAFLIGVTLQGGFNGLYPLAAQIYPTSSRSAGVGRAMGVGRGGAVLGPLLGGYLLTAGLPLPALFGIFAAPLLVAGACAFLVASRSPAKI
jgi:benzoate transport